MQITHAKTRFSWRVVLVSAFTAVFVTMPAHALKAVENFESQPIPSELSLQQVKKTIVLSGGKRGWLIREVGPRQMEATLNVRKHTVVVDITLSGDSYSITYNTSVNMKYDGVGKIHGRYNKWVANLNSDIQRGLVAATYN